MLVDPVSNVVVGDSQCYIIVQATVAKGSTSFVLVVDESELCGSKVAVIELTEDLTRCWIACRLKGDQALVLNEGIANLCPSRTVNLIDILLSIEAIFSVVIIDEIVLPVNQRGSSIGIDISVLYQMY